MGKLDFCRLNAAEMYVDVGKTEDGTFTNWVAESGVLDLFLLLGPTPAKVRRPACWHWGLEMSPYRATQ